MCDWNYYEPINFKHQDIGSPYPQKKISTTERKPLWISHNLLKDNKIQFDSSASRRTLFEFVLPLQLIARFATEKTVLVFFHSTQYLRYSYPQEIFGNTSKTKDITKQWKKSWEFWNIDENTRLAQRKHRPYNNSGSEIYPVNKRFTTHLKQIFVQTSENIHLIFSELKNKLCYSTSHENWRYKSIL